MRYQRLGVSKGTATPLSTSTQSISDHAHREHRGPGAPREHAPDEAPLPEVRIPSHTAVICAKAQQTDDGIGHAGGNTETEKVEQCARHQKRSGPADGADFAVRVAAGGATVRVRPVVDRLSRTGAPPLPGLFFEVSDAPPEPGCGFASLRHSDLILGRCATRRLNASTSGSPALISGRIVV